MPGGSSGQPPQVLVVDDAPALREQLSELLPEFGIPVIAAVERGEQAVPAISAALATGIRVSVVVMDVRMPGIGGLEATRQVRAVFPHVQVILHTVYGGHLEEQAREVGAFAEVAKGAGVQLLIEMVLAAHQEARSAQAAAAS